jgi:hypothetical protein
VVSGHFELGINNAVCERYSCICSEAAGGPLSGLIAVSSDMQQVSREAGAAVPVTAAAATTT